MATDKERVTSYLDSALHKKLEKFQRTQGLKTLSKAVVKALENYFTLLEQQPAQAKKQTIKEIKGEIEEMQVKIDTLFKKVEDLEIENQEEE